MLRRLLALLLICGLALPAVALPMHCVGGGTVPAVSAGHDHHGMARPAPAKIHSAMPDCIGCAALQAPAEAPAAPVASAAMPPAGPRLRTMLSQRRAPEIPPPRFLS